MRCTVSSHTCGERGFTMIEVLLVVVILGLLSAIAIPIYTNTIEDTRRNALLTDSVALYKAFVQYNVDYGQFPSDSGPSKFDVASLAPLSTEGYFGSASTMLNKLSGQSILFYWGIDIGGTDAEFYAVSVAADDPTLIVVVASTSIITDVNGNQLDGVYVWENFKFIPLSEA